MSLQVWLPLTKDLRQQGLSDVTVTNNGATFNSAGKLGGCYYFNRSSSNYLKINNPLTSSANGVSMAFWVKLPSNGSVNDQLVHIGNGSGWTNNRFTCFVRGGNSTLIFCCGDGTNSTQYNCVSSALTLNQWTHVTCIYKSNKMMIYLNGSLDKEYNTNIVPSFTNVAYIGVGAGPNITEPATAYLNDIRIYDHALSQMEVKELAKGLVLHYPLNRNGWGQENLLARYVVPGQGAPTSTASGGRTTWLGDYAITIPATENADTYFRLFMTEQLVSGQIYTISCQASGLISGTYYNFPMFAQNNSSMGYLSINHNGLCTMTFTMTWTGTQTAATGANGETVYVNFLDDITRTIATGQGPITLTHFKLEKGSIATPWCPNSSDELAITMGLNSTTEYDCSGFCNNGTRTGTFSWSSDTPKYNVSTVFNGSSCIDTNINYLGNEWSYGGWIYSATSSRSWEGVLMLNGTNPADADLQFGFYTCPKSNIIQNSANGKYNSSISWTYGAWHHFMGTYDGATLKTYIDGVLVNSTGITQAFLERHNFVIGARHSSGTNHDCYFLGNISDVRIYATTLSASDVKSLYQNSAYIDSSGNVYGAVHTEV